MDPKMVSEFNPQNGSKNGTQKEDPIGVPFLDSISGSNSDTIFGFIFQPPF